MSMQSNGIGSADVARGAISMAISENREDERSVKAAYAQKGIRCCAVDFGGEYLESIVKMVERAVVAAKREGIIHDTHKHIGGVAGACHEAVQQISAKAFGLSLGGKIGIARHEDHLSVCVFFGIGLLHLNEVAIGIGHRAI